MTIRTTLFKSVLVLCLTFIAGITHADPLTEFKNKLSQYQGKVVYVDFWASWCGPCRKSFPWMNEMKSTYQSQGFEIISINLDSNFALAQTFLFKFPASFDVIYDPEGVLAKKYQVKGMPSSFIIDRNSIVTNAHVGFTDKKSRKYKKELVALLDQK